MDFEKLVANISEDLPHPCLQTLSFLIHTLPPLVLTYFMDGLFCQLPLTISWNIIVEEDCFLEKQYSHGSTLDRPILRPTGQTLGQSHHVAGLHDV